MSDGFPTTYLKNKNGTYYIGYEPYSTSGTKGKDVIFYDALTGYYRQYGTSYSNKGAIRARKMTTTILDQGGTIFSIGVDLGG